MKIHPYILSTEHLIFIKIVRDWYEVRMIETIHLAIAHSIFKSNRTIEKSRNAEHHPHLNCDGDLLYEAL